MGWNSAFSILQTRSAFAPYNIFQAFLFQAKSMTFVFGFGHMDYVMEKLSN